MPPSSASRSPDAGGRPARPWLTIVLDDCSCAVAGWSVCLGALPALNLSPAPRQTIWRKSAPPWAVHGLPLSVRRSRQRLQQRAHHGGAASLHIRIVHSAVTRPQGRAGRAVHGPGHRWRASARGQSTRWPGDIGLQSVYIGPRPRRLRRRSRRPPAARRGPAWPGPRSHGRAVTAALAGARVPCGAAGRRADGGGRACR
jgi:hypothetical protein